MAKQEVLNAPSVIGTDGGLRAVLHWRNDYGTDGPVGRTWGDIQFWIKDTLVWGNPTGDRGIPQGIRWSWVDLLEFLAIAWPYLEEEETYPIAFGSRFEAPRHLGELRGRAKLRWRKIPAEEAEVEEERLDEFLLVHDLAMSLKGATPPTLLLLRQGNLMQAGSKDREWLLDYTDCMETLERIGDQVAARIADLDDPRSQLARARWHARGVLDPKQRLQIATGLPQAELDQVWPIIPNQPTAAPYALKAAARMIGSHLPAPTLRGILARIQSLAPGSPAALKNPRTIAERLMEDNADEAAYLQGSHLAVAIRDALTLGTGMVDPEGLLCSLGVDIQEIALDDAHLDAIAVWGDGHRPTVMINTNGARSRFPSGRRSTCAHELCHLLVDTAGALPAVEVLGGHVPQDLEQRANAFAAELLLPHTEAGRVLREHLAFVHTADARSTEVKDAVSQLTKDYQVSHEVAAWQIRRSGQLPYADEDALQPFLKSIHNPYY